MGIHAVVDEGRGHEVKSTFWYYPPLFLLVCIRIGLECVFSARETSLVPRLVLGIGQLLQALDHLHCILGNLRLYSVATSQFVGSMIRVFLRVIDIPLGDIDMLFILILIPEKKILPVYSVLCTSKYMYYVRRIAMSANGSITMITPWSQLVLSIIPH